MEDVSSLSHRRLSTILKDPSHPNHAAAKAEHDRRNMKDEAFGRANFTQQLKKKGIDVDKMHSDNIKDANAAKKRATAASKDLASFRKKNGMTSESKDEFEPHMMYDPKTGKAYKANKPEDHERMSKMGYSHDKPKVNEVSAKTLSNYMRKSTASAGKPRQDVRTMDKRIGGQKMADDKLRKMQGKGSAAKVAATEESVNELSKDTMQSYWDKTKGDDAFSGTRKANNRLKGAINVTTKLDRLKKMTKR